MTDDMMGLQGPLEKRSDANLLRKIIGFAAKRLMELEVEGLTAVPRSRPPSSWKLMELEVEGLTAVVQDAYIQGVSTRSVDDLVQAMGMSGISKSKVSRLCGEIDGKIQSLLYRPLEGDWFYLWLDATCVKVCKAGPIVPVAATVAVGVNDQGRREVLGMAIHGPKAETFWTKFLCPLILLEQSEEWARLKEIYDAGFHRLRERRSNRQAPRRCRLSIPGPTPRLPIRTLDLAPRDGTRSHECASRLPFFQLSPRRNRTAVPACRSVA